MNRRESAQTGALPLSEAQFMGRGRKIRRNWLTTNQLYFRKPANNKLNMFFDMLLLFFLLSPVFCIFTLESTIYAKGRLPQRHPGQQGLKHQ